VEEEAAGIPLAAVVADTPAVAAATPVEAITRRLQEQVDVNEVKTEARRGVLNGAPFFCGRKFQGFKVSRSITRGLDWKP
jgi:hypothetical protein